MKRSIFVSMVVLMTFFVAALNATEPAEPAIPGPTKAAASSTSHSPTLTLKIDPPSATPLDFLKPTIPKSFGQSPKVVVKRAPNLLPLITELVRHQELSELADQVMPYVYIRGSEVMVADYEDAVYHLEIADECLYDAMIEALVADPTLFRLNTSLIGAGEHIDEAELTFHFLRELALLEL